MDESYIILKYGDVYNAYCHWVDTTRDELTDETLLLNRFFDAMEKEKRGKLFANKIWDDCNGH